MEKKRDRKRVSGLSRQTKSHRRKNLFSLASTLQPLQAIRGAAQAALDRWLVSHDLVESVAVRDGVLVGRERCHVRPSHCAQIFDKRSGDLDCGYASNILRVSGLKFSVNLARCSAFNNSFASFSIQGHIGSNSGLIATSLPLKSLGS